MWELIAVTGDEGAYDPAVAMEEGFLSVNVGYIPDMRSPCFATGQRVHLIEPKTHGAPDPQTQGRCLHARMRIAV